MGAQSLGLDLHILKFFHGAQCIYSFIFVFSLNPKEKARVENFGNDDYQDDDDDGNEDDMVMMMVAGLDGGDDGDDGDVFLE